MTPYYFHLLAFFFYFSPFLRAQEYTVDAEARLWNVPNVPTYGVATDIAEVGSLLNVKNPANNRTVLVEVIQVLPHNYSATTILLSKAAFGRLGYRSQEPTTMEVQVFGYRKEPIRSNKRIVSTPGPALALPAQSEEGLAALWPDPIKDAPFQAATNIAPPGSIVWLFNKKEAKSLYVEVAQPLPEDLSSEYTVLLSSKAMAKLGKPGESLISIRYEVLEARQDSSGESYQLPLHLNPTPRPAIYYPVGANEYLYDIAAKYRVRPEALKKWNDLSSYNIQPGQRLVLYPGGNQNPYREDIYLPPPSEKENQNLEDYGANPYTGELYDYITTSPSDDPLDQLANSIRTPRSHVQPPLIHTVTQGEFLYDIAHAYNLNIADLKRWNNLRDYNVSPGQRLYVSPPTNTSLPHNFSANEIKTEAIGPEKSLIAASHPDTLMFRHGRVAFSTVYPPLTQLKVLNPASGLFLPLWVVGPPSDEKAELELPLIALEYLFPEGIPSQARLRTALLQKLQVENTIHPPGYSIVKSLANVFEDATTAVFQEKQGGFKIRHPRVPIGTLVLIERKMSQPTPGYTPHRRPNNRSQYPLSVWAKVVGRPQAKPPEEGLKVEVSSGVYEYLGQNEREPMTVALSYYLYEEK